MRIGRNEPGGVGEYTDFIEEAEGPKPTLHIAWIAGGRQESTAEHSWQLALFAGVIYGKFPKLNRKKVLIMCLVHDLGEQYNGSILVALRPGADDKLNRGRKGIWWMCRFLPEERAGKVSGLWEEHNRGITPEARLVKVPDKAETIIRCGQGRNPAGFGYALNLDYGREYSNQDERLEALRDLIDTEAEKRMEQHRRNRGE